MKFLHFINKSPIFAPLNQKKMRNFTLYNLLAAAAISMLASCTSNSDIVSISGTISEGQGEKLALMHLKGNNPVLVDTLTLGADGSFKFKPQVEKGGPDFFCLVMNGQTIPVISDTLQTPIVINAEKSHFGSQYEVKDSLNSILQKAVALGSDLRRSMLNLATSHNQGKVSDLLYSDSLQTLISDYKANVLDQYIYRDPASPVSYYLLFETVQGLQIFDPYDAKDSRAYGAVANLWLHTYPNSERTSYLEQRAREGMVYRYKAARDQQYADSLIQNAIVESSNFIDLNLIGVNDTNVALSSIAGKGNVTLVDFTAYYITDISVAHNMELQKVYERYKNQGLKIYQICMDPDVNFWKVSAANLPWTVVRDTDLLFDEQGLVQYSGAAAIYNVSNIPTTFVLGKDGTPVSRIEDDAKLDAAINKAL